jgi:predicted O-linked N-acetylglucosamine transferase (SPINDLY family)
MHQTTASSTAASEAVMRLAIEQHRRGQMHEAERLCREVLRQRPHHAEALHLLGLLAVQARQPQAGVDLMRRSLAVDPDQPSALSNLAVALLDLKLPEESLKSAERALALKPDFTLALTVRGNALRALGREREALSSLRRAVALNPGNAITLNNYGNCCMALGQHQEAIAAFQSALQVRPQDSIVAANLSVALLLVGQAQEALAPAEQAARSNPTQRASWLQLGRVQLERKDYGAALQAFERALAVPHAASGQVAQTRADAEVLWLRAVALQKLQRSGDAIASLRAAVNLEPQFAPAWSALAGVLCEAQRLAEGIECFERALALNPDDTNVLMRHGYACRLAQRPLEAAASLERLVLLDPNNAAAWYGLGMAVRKSDLARAISALEQMLRLKGDVEYGLGALQYARANACDWTAYDTHAAQLVAGVRAGQRIDHPFTFLSVSADADAQLRCARISLKTEEETFRLEPAPRYQHARLRVGYLSGDFRDHPLAYLLTGVLERHDRTRFESFALSLRPADHDAYSTRIQSAVDHFIDLSRLNDHDAAVRVRALEIDILIDLVGHTQGARWDIVAARPAPLQVNYLGFPGSLGASYIDYLIADEYLIPREFRQHYAEQILYLPECFQANDDQRPVPSDPPPRSSLGLPEDAPVLCCFNNSYKLNPTFFSLWIRLLHAMPGSVLWLVAATPLVENNLRREAGARGIAPERLIFAPRLPYAQHLARLRAADLFLDTLPFNGGTTVSDALWVGLPVLTCSGEALASRMAGSLLRTVGLGELIAPNLLSYEQLALALLTDPERIARLRTHLIAQRSSCPLFNTLRFTRHFEAALLAIHQRFAQGFTPAHLGVPPLS